MEAKGHISALSYKPIEYAQSLSDISLAYSHETFNIDLW